MPRLPEILQREALPEGERKVFDYLEKTRGSVRLPFSTMLGTPELTYRIVHVGSYVRFESSLPDTTRELAILSAARELDAHFEWSAHARFAREYGVSQETIDIIANKRDLSLLNEEEALPVRWGREVFNDHKISDATWKAAVARFGEKGTLELASTVGYYAMLASIFNAIDIHPPADAPQQLPDL